MVNPEMLGEMIRQHQQEMLAQAQRRQQARQAQAAQAETKRIILMQATKLMILNRF